MAGERLDIVCPRSGKDGKTYFSKIGVAWPLKNGGYSLTFEALPLPSLNEGQLETRVLLMPPRDNANQRPAPQRRGSMSDLDDSVPF